MCGIAGIVDFRQRPEEALLSGMIGRLRHRGPDACGLYLGRQAGLASARLRIIDLPGGDQPIPNEDRSLWIVYNGEVYNYPELRQGLIERGHRLATRTDTEVILHLYEEKGPELFSSLNGQFAFALWDQPRQRLLLGRDRLGVRPLFYAHDSGRLVFASEIKALFADSRIPRRIEARTLGDVFTCWAPLGPATAFQGIFQVPPGHYAWFTPRGLSLKRYWGVRFPVADGGRSSADWTAELQSLIRDAVRIRLRADVPVGTYLSGGLDSTLISALVQSLHPGLCTVSVRFTDPRFDETAFQDRAARACGGEHRSVCCTERDIAEDFPRVIWHTEVPILRTAPAPLYRLARLVREIDLKVVLTGEGADEIFAGYDIFKEDRVRRFLARRPESRLRSRLLPKLYPDVFSGERGKAFREHFFRRWLSPLDSPAFSHLVRWENTAHLQAFFSPELREELARGEGFLERFAAQLPEDFLTWDPLSRAQHTEISIFLGNYLLSSQGDRMAMAHGVEGRFPFLDHRVVEFACALPHRLRLNGLKEKFLLRRAAQGSLPEELAHRPKQPYRAPVASCFLGNGAPDYVSELLSMPALGRSGIFHPARVGRLVAKAREQGGRLLSERENMALVGILSTQLLDHLFVCSFPPSGEARGEGPRVFTS